MFSKTLLSCVFANVSGKTAPVATVTLQARSYSAGNKANTLIIGAPGSGKGTISNWIVRKIVNNNSDQDRLKINE